MPISKVCVEVEGEKVIRIFRNNHDVYKVDPDRVRQLPKSVAVKAIREQVFARSEGKCEYCGNVITWNSMHMHEELPKGNGGEVSLTNSKGICYQCHLGPNGAHGNRRWHTARIQEEAHTP